MGRYFHELSNESKNVKTEPRVKSYDPDSVFKYPFGPENEFWAQFQPKYLFIREFKPLWLFFKLWMLRCSTNLFHFTFFFKQKKERNIFSLLSFSGEIPAKLRRL